MAFKGDVKYTMRPGADLKIKGNIALRWKRFTQECVGEVKRNSPPPPKFGPIEPSGVNKRSINPGGAVTSDGRTDIDPGNIRCEVYGTSGYSGYLNNGTRYMAAREYFVSSVERVYSSMGQAIFQGAI